MKNKQKNVVAKLLLLVLLCLTALTFAQPGNTPQRKAAAEGDTIWVVVNHIKQDKRAQFEKFIYETFWPASGKLTPNAQRAFTHTRVLNPAGPEEDGTYTYIFLMDPVLEREDYGIESLLRKMYPRAQADAYYKMFLESLARDGTHYKMLQSKFWGTPK